MANVTVASTSGLYQITGTANVGNSNVGIANVTTASSGGLYQTFSNPTILNSAQELLTLLHNNGNIAFSLAAGNTQVEAFALAAGSNYNNASAAAYIPTDPTITTMQATQAGSATYANVNFATKTALQILDANVGGSQAWANAHFITAATVYGNSNVAAYLPTDPTITTIQSTQSGSATYANVNFATKTALQTLDANVGGSQIWANAHFVNTSTPLYANANVTAYLPTYTGNLSPGNIIPGNIYTNNYYWANGAPLSFGSTYGNANVAIYLPTYTGNLYPGNIATNGYYWANGAPLSFGSTYGNANVAVYLPTDPTILAIQSGATAANAHINTLDANVGAYEIATNAAINSLATGANANTAAYLTTYTGNISAGNFLGGNVFVSGTNGNITSATSNVALALNRLDYSLWNLDTSGHLAWANAAPYYSITGNTFTVVTAGNGFVDGKFVSWTAPQNITLPGNAAELIYVDINGTLQQMAVSGVPAQSQYDDKIPLFTAFNDGNGNIIVAREDHDYATITNTVEYIHTTIGTVVTGSGGNMTRVTTGTGSAITDREIKIVGNAIINDAGLTTNITDSGGSAVSLKFYYTNAVGKWIQYANQADMPMVYNNAGTITPLPNNQYTVIPVYVSKDGATASPVPDYIGLIHSTNYSNLAGALDAIGNNSIVTVSNELQALQLAQLGYIIISENASGGQISQIVIKKSTIAAQLGGGGSGGDASLVTVDPSTFVNFLSNTDTTVQTAFNDIDARTRTANVGNTIVLRDSVGNFAANVVTVGNVISTNGYFWANGFPYTKDIDAHLSTLDANVGSFETTTNASIASINSNIIAANTHINTLDANVGAYEIWANAQFSSITGGSYSNSNVASYLPIYSGNLSANVLSVNNTITSATFKGNVANAVVETYTFTSNSSWTYNPPPSYRIGSAIMLISAGGGGGGGTAGNIGGGGGAGGFMHNVDISSNLTVGNTYTVTIGAGGAVNTNGGNTSIFGYTMVGGGRGGAAAQNGANGGSGGGGGGYVASGGTGIAGQGFAGYSGTAYPQGGGGGGAGGAATSMAGGAGVTDTISGSSVTYGIGGDGGASYYNGPQATTPGSGGPGAGNGGPANVGANGIVIIQITWIPQYGGIYSTGNIQTTGYYIGNGSKLNGVYANANAASYLPTDSTIIGINSNVTAANAHINTLDANVGSFETYANVTYATKTALQTLDANVGGHEIWANTAINSLATGANANTAAYLTTFAGNIQANVITASSTNCWTIPAGGNSARPGFAANGSIRFNTDIISPEWYDGANTTWYPFYKQPVSNYNAWYVIVGGGGAGGTRVGAGGGAGGYIEGNVTISSGTTYTITIGSGGSAVTTQPGQVGTIGGNSSAFGFTAIGGGGGGAYIGTNGTAGTGGGSGGGGSYSGAGGTAAAGSGTVGQGKDGGAGNATNPSGGGGGGAGAVGTSVTTAGAGNGGNGGIGNATVITGSSVYYAGGGGGGADTGTSGTGGTGGGGAGAGNGNGNGTAGTVNTGGGGGGARDNGDIAGVSSGAGGSGIVIMSVPTASFSGNSNITGSYNYVINGTNTVISWTSSGSYKA
ncbi:MAG TPA: hypothetical protein VFM18_11705 [Methanosarcina sp.]|nr:hypothetical protein [Methanosarcina sp.]